MAKLKIMKHINLLKVICLCLVIWSCDSDSGDPQITLSDNPGIEAIINGGTYTNYRFANGIYQISLGNSNQNMSINAGDDNGHQLTLFLNGTGGFSTGAVKTIGDTDSDNFRTYVLIREANSQVNYYATTGSISINRYQAHPNKSGFRVISGVFNISATSEDGMHNTSMTGGFTDLEFQE